MDALPNTHNHGMVWVLEDDSQMRRIFKSILQSYKCVYFKTLKEFSTEWKKEDRRPTLLLADLTLPDGSFLDWMEKNSHFNLSTNRCIVISGMQDISSMRTCLRLGALDYIVKPFVPAEVEIKVERILETTKLPLTLDPHSHSIEFDCKTSILTSKQYQILSLLHSAYPSGVERKEIQSLVWKSTRVNDRNLTVHLSLLRTKLKEIGLSISLQDSMYVLETI
jgi:DNA-binding response OmpR family regulator